jgi:hypothetical protein
MCQIWQIDVAKKKTHHPWDKKRRLCEAQSTKTAGLKKRIA